MAKPIGSFAGLSEEEWGINSCNHASLSLIKRCKDRLIFPAYFYEDYLAEVCDDLDIECDHVSPEQVESLGLQQAYRSVCVDDLTLAEIKALRAEAYSALVWYEPLANFTYRSHLLPLCIADPSDDDEWEHVVRRVLDQAGDTIAWPVFIKLDSVSPKDAHTTCVFDDIEQVVTAFRSSARVRNTLRRPLLSRLSHALFVREVDPLLLCMEMENESERKQHTTTQQTFVLRCFIHHQVLVAISSDAQHETKVEERRLVTLVEAFFQQETWKAEFPYTDATVDLRVYLDASPSVLESTTCPSSSTSASAAAAVSAASSSSSPSPSSSPSTSSCKLIEINNFGADANAGAGQFSWKDDYLLLHGAWVVERGVEFRGAPGALGDDDDD